MYKIVGVTSENLYDVVSKAEDPFLIDIRDIKDEALSVIYGKDYIHIRQLSNKGITMIILRAEVRGLMRLQGVLERCKGFLREVIILYDDEKHYNYIRSLI